MLKALWLLIRKTDRMWIVPVVLLLVIAGLLVVTAQISPLPIFLYPLL